MATVDVRIGVDQALDIFSRADADCRLMILWRIYHQLGQTFASVVPAALFSQVVQQLLRQIQQLPRTDRLDALRDIVSGEETRFGQQYHSLNLNMKLAFWYRLSHEVRLSSWAGTGKYHRICPEAQSLFPYLDEMDFNQQIHFLRQALNITG